MAAAVAAAMDGADAEMGQTGLLDADQKYAVSDTVPSVQGVFLFCGQTAVRLKALSLSSRSAHLCRPEARCLSLYSPPTGP